MSSANITTFSEEQRELQRQRRLLRKEIRKVPRGDCQLWLNVTEKHQPQQQHHLQNNASENGKTVTSDLLNSLDAKTSTQQSSLVSEKGQLTDSAHRPRIATHAAHSIASKRKKQREGGANMTDDIAHVTVDLDKIRRKTIKDFAKTWKSTDHLMVPSMRSEIVVQLMDEEPINFNSKEIDRVDLFDRYRQFEEFDQIREESKKSSSEKKTVSWK